MEEVDDEALVDLFISTLISSECTRFLDKFQQYRHNVCRAPATEIAPSPFWERAAKGVMCKGTNLCLLLNWTGLIVLGSCSAFGQGATAAISGIVRASTGAVVPGATITAKHLESGPMV